MSTRFSDDERVAYLKRFGVHAQAFTGMQDGMEYFDVPGVGYAAHAGCWGARFVLGDPVADPADFPRILDAIVTEHPGAVFFEVTAPVAAHLRSRHGFHGTHFGHHARVALADWSLAGDAKKSIRMAVNRAKARGITFREAPLDPHTDSVSARWLATRQLSRELRFIVRPRAQRYQEGVRRFYAFEDGAPVGFVFFDPIYEAGRVIAYIPNVSRASPEFRHGLWYALMVHAIEVFRAEGVRYVELGHMPLSLDPVREPGESVPLRRTFEAFRRHGRFVYDFGKLEFTKRRFRGQLVKTYLGHRTALPLWMVPPLLRLSGVV